MTQTASLSVTERFSLSMFGLRGAVAARIVGNVLSVALMTLIWTKLHQVEARVLRLIAAIREGRVRGGWVCPGRASAVRAEGLRTPVAQLPRGFAWLCVLVPYYAAGFGSQLRHLLGDPEMVALIAATPQLGKALRPLCRMLGIAAELVTPAIVVTVCEDVGGEPGVIGEATPEGYGIEGLPVDLGAGVTGVTAGRFFSPA